MLDADEVVSRMRERFTSGNSVPVPQARITAEEWKALYEELTELGRAASEDSAQLDAAHKGCGALWQESRRIQHQLRLEVERLRERLEVDIDYPEWDGIACRDETIRQIEAENSRLRQLLPAQWRHESGASVTAKESGDD